MVAGILTYGDSVLACRRAAHKAAAGKWEFPGGKIEPGESPKAALKREILEELGLEISVLELLNTSITSTNGLVIQLECYWAKCADFPSHSSDHDSFLLVGPDEITSLDWADPDLPAVQLVKTQMQRKLG